MEYKKVERLQWHSMYNDAEIERDKIVNPDKVKRFSSNGEPWHYYGNPYYYVRY